MLSRVSTERTRLTNAIMHRDLNGRAFCRYWAENGLLREAIFVSRVVANHGKKPSTTFRMKGCTGLVRQLEIAFCDLKFLTCCFQRPPTVDNGFQACSTIVARRTSHSCLTDVGLGNSIQFDPTLARDYDFPSAAGDFPATFVGGLNACESYNIPFTR